jgi:hypothetical protein
MAKCMDLLNRVTKGSRCPYLAFTCISPGSFEIIDGLREKKNGSLPQIALLYDKVEETLIVKLMVGFVYECVGEQFKQTFERTLTRAMQYVLVPYGSARYGNPGGRSREPDFAYKPHSRLLESE